MRSATKIRLDADDLARAVSVTFSGDRRLAGWTELTEGYFSAAYALELDDGSRFVLKAAPPPDVPVLRYERDLMAPRRRRCGYSASTRRRPCRAW